MLQPKFARSRLYSHKLARSDLQQEEQDSRQDDDDTCFAIARSNP